MATVRVPIYQCEPLQTELAVNGRMRVEPGHGNSGVNATVVLSGVPRRGDYLRKSIDRSLFTLRLWSIGAFSCPYAFAETGEATAVGWYATAWRTWDSSGLECPLSWAAPIDALRRVWEQVLTLRDLEEPRLRRFASFHFYPVAVDRFSMLFMSADGLLFPIHGKRLDRRHEFGRRGGRVLSPLIGEPESRLACELRDYYDKRCGHFHGTSRHLGRHIQRPAERLELFVRHLLLHLLDRGILRRPRAAEDYLAGV